MNWFALHLASGLSLFSGTALVCAGAFLTALPKGRLTKLGRSLAVAVGTLFVVLSSSPFPGWVYALLLVAAIGWSCTETAQPPRWQRARLFFRWAFPGFCLLLSALELPHQWMPSLPKAQYSRAFVIGDSLSAGIDDSVRQWPALLAERRKLAIVNLAKPGATLRSAMAQAAQLPDGANLVLFEIGGNDLLGTPKPPEFERDLRVLLQAVCRTNRGIVMFELPLLPLQARYGRLQRTLAAEHGVWLVPKRFLAGVLGSPGATVDGLHLSSKGSQLMAQMVDQTIGALLPERPPGSASQSVASATAGGLKR